MTEHYYNEIVRAGNNTGIPMIHQLTVMLCEATIKAGTNEVARGRMRGLAQALAFIKSPVTYQSTTNRQRLAMIQLEETNARAAIRQSG